MNCLGKTPTNIGTRWLRHIIGPRSTLHNTLPEGILAKLQTQQERVAEHYPDVTVLFADISGFTHLCNDLPPNQLVRLLNHWFCCFDDVVAKYGLEKIKTNGDQYMAVAGAPDPADDHAQRGCHCALAMLAEFNQRVTEHYPALGLRIGLASGDVIAGVIGKDKYTFDVWGRTVNLAARMESQGTPGRIQVASSTQRLADNCFAFKSRGRIHFKGFGVLDTYWLLNEHKLHTQP